MSMITKIICKYCGYALDVILNGSAESIAECPVCHKVWAAKRETGADGATYDDGVTVQEILAVTRKEKQEDQCRKTEENKSAGTISSFEEECLEEEEQNYAAENDALAPAVKKSKGYDFDEESPEKEAARIKTEKERLYQEFLKVCEVEGDTLKKYNGDGGDVVIPDKIIHIGDEAFKDCKNLTSILIPNSVTSIGEWAFADCEVLTSVEIPAGVTSIGTGAFEYCKGLTSVTIPDSVTSIGDWAFADCKELASIQVDPKNETYRSESNCLIHNETNTLIAGCKSSVIPNSVTAIGDWAFDYCTDLTHIKIPNSVTSIGDCAFSGCTGLTSVTIPSSVRSIGYGAFADCTSLTSITVPFVGRCYYKEQRVPFFGNKEKRIAAFKENMDRWAANMLAENHFGYIFGALSCNKNNESVPSSLKTVIITGGDSIGSRAFYGCEGLTSITIPNSVECIDKGAFTTCTGLKSVTMPRRLAGFMKNDLKSIFDKEQLKKIKFTFTK